MPRPAIDRGYIRRKQRAQTKRGNLWRAMRMLRRFTAGDLCAVCETDRHKAVLVFLSQLRRTGFVAIAHQGNQAYHEPNTFRLVRDTGPRPPAVLARRRSMFDPNTETEYPFAFES